MFYALICIFIFASARGLYQKFYSFNYLLEKHYAELKPEFISRLQSGRIFSCFVLPSIFAAVIIMLSIYFCGKYKQCCRKKSEKIIFNIFIIISGLCVYYTKTVSAILSLAASILLLYPAKYKKKIVFVGFFFPAIALLFIYNRGFENFYSSSVKYYISNYIAAAAMWKNEDKFIGVGFGNFHNFFEKYKTLYGNEIIYAHNYYLHILAENGILGFLLFAFFIWIIINRIIIKSNCPVYLKMIIIFFLFNNLYGPDGHILSEILMFSFFLGCSVKSSIQ